MDTNPIHTTLFNAFKVKGFAAPCSNDMAQYLTSCICRPSPTNIAGTIKDIDDIIYALNEYKASFIANVEQANLSYDLQVLNKLKPHYSSLSIAEQAAITPEEYYNTK